MFGQTSATIVGAALFIMLIVLDIWGANDDLPGNTVSEWVRSLSRYTAVVPWALGVLHGHWFHPIDGLDPLFGARSTWVLIGLSLAVLVGRVVLRNLDGLWRPWLWAALGALAGTLLWPV